MKRTLLITGASALMLMAAACNEKTEVVEDGPIEKASAESGVGSNPVSNAAQDAASGAVGAVSAATLGRTTEGFVTNAAMSDMYEIQSSQLALKQAQSADLKKYAQMMVTDHTKMTADLKKAAGSAQGVTVPTALDERRQGMLDNLKQATGAKFDEVYREQQAAAHQEALTLARTYADAGDNAALKAHASKGAPMIENHLQMVRSMGEGGAANGAAQPARPAG